MPKGFDGRIDTGEHRSSEQPDLFARYLLVIITSGIVLTIAVLEIWLLLTR